MGAFNVTDRIYPPKFSKRFTSFGAQLILHSTAAPAACQFLPCQVIVEISDTTGKHFDYIDSAGTMVSLVFKAIGNYVLRMAPTSIETTTTADSVTVFWAEKD